MNLLNVILPALLPVVIDTIKTVLARITNIPKYEPKDINEKIALMKAETERLSTVAKLDEPTGEVSKWVADLRASNRYILGNLIIFITFVYIMMPEPNIEIVNFLLNLSASVFSFFFGDRVYMHLKRG